MTDKALDKAPAFDNSHGNHTAIAGEVGETSDGYHTFNELYEHRHALFIALCRNRKAYVGFPSDVWRSRHHADGTMFPGWFVMGIGEAPGQQLTYHLPERLWEETHFAAKRPRAPEWDGHTPADVVTRLLALR